MAQPHADMRAREDGLTETLGRGRYKRHLGWMERMGLALVGDAVQITPKGIETYWTLVAWIKDAVGEERL